MLSTEPKTSHLLQHSVSSESSCTESSDDIHTMSAFVSLSSSFSPIAKKIDNHHPIIGNHAMSTTPSHRGSLSNNIMKTPICVSSTSNSNMMKLTKRKLEEATHSDIASNSFFGKTLHSHPGHPLITTPRVKLVCRSEQEASAYTPLPAIYPQLKHRKQKKKETYRLNIISNAQSPSDTRNAGNDCSKKLKSEQSMFNSHATQNGLLNMNVCNNNSLEAADQETHQRIFRDYENHFSEQRNLDAIERRTFIMVKWSLTTNEYLRLNYSVLNLVGWGACGAVLRGVRRSDGLSVAIKIIYKKLKANNNQVRANESDILSELNHPYIVMHYETFEDQLAFYMVMEYFGTVWRRPGDPEVFHPSVPHLVVEPLLCSKCKDKIKRQTRKRCAVDANILITVGQASCSSLYDFIEYHNSRIPRHLIKRIFRQVVEGVAYIHDMNVVHGDIKEENILIGYPISSMNTLTEKVGHHLTTRKLQNYPRTRSAKIQSELDNTLIAKLCDFGHAINVKRGSKRLVRYGTRELSAPELYENFQPADTNNHEQSIYFGYAQDVWALGFLLYTMLNGNLPEDLSDYLSGKKKLDPNGSFPAKFTDASIEEECLDLVNQLLKVDPECRITIHGVLAHPWMQTR